MGAPKNFYNAVDQAKLGIDQIPGMVKDIADIKEDISEITPLPDVTSADNGDVLTVIEGAWGKGTPGKQVHLIEIMRMLSDVEFADGITTLSSVIALLNKGENVVFAEEKFGSHGTTYDYYIIDEWSDDRPNYIIAHELKSDYEYVPEINDGIKFCMIMFYNSNTGSYHEYTIPAGLPDVTSADNGDLLEVVSGAWSKSGDVKTRIDYLYDYLNLSGEELIHSYDFTVNANDTITDNPINLDPNTGASFTSGGAAITANDLMQIRGIGSVCGFNRRLMFEFGAMNITAVGNLMSVYNGSYIKWDGTSWKVNGTDTEITNPNYFYNKTLQIKFGSSYNDVTMTTQDGVFYKGAFDPTGQFNGIMYGGYTPNGGCCYSMYLKSLKVYAAY